MTLDQNTLLSLLALVVTGPVAWLAGDLLKKIRQVERDIADHKVHVAEHYVEKTDLHRQLEEIKSMIKRIFDKMDGRPQ